MVCRISDNKFYRIDNIRRMSETTETITVSLYIIGKVAIEVAMWVLIGYVAYWSFVQHFKLWALVL